MQHSMVERRRGPDRLQRSFSWLALICWGLFLLVMLAFHYARPELEYGLFRYWGLDIRSHWDPNALPLFLYALWGCCGITLVSVVLNSSRNRRMEDYHIYYFVLLLLISLATLVTYYLGGF